MNRLAVRNRKAMAKKGKNVKIQGPKALVAVDVRADDELPDIVLNKYKAADYMNMFLGRLPKRVEPIGFDSPRSVHIFKVLIDTFIQAGASKRGVARCLTMIAKNIQPILSELKLPLTSLNLRRITAYKEGLAYKFKSHLLPEGSVEHLLACDSLPNTEYDVTVTKRPDMIELSLMSLTNGSVRTFRFVPDQLSNYIHNREVLDEIKKCGTDTDG